MLSQTADERCEMETDGTWIQNYEYCERYYLCKDGIAAPGECLDERWFNPTTQSCDLPFSFRCTSANSPNPPAPEPEPEPELDTCPERGIAKLKHPYSCQKCKANDPFKLLFDFQFLFRHNLR